METEENITYKCRKNIQMFNIVYCLEGAEQP
jgi:hypothetical protein